MKLINLAHVLFTGPLLIYVGLAKQKPVWVYYLLLALGIFLALYFIYVIFTKTLSPYHVWLLIHLLIFIPLLIWCGIAKDKTPHIILSIILAIGTASVGFHLIRIVQSVIKI